MDIHTAEMFLETDGEQETLACAELRRLLKTAMATLRVKKHFAEIARDQGVTQKTGWG